MGQLVRLVIGDWERGGLGAWKFNVDHTSVKYDVVLKENERYCSLLKLFHSKYKLDQLLRPTEPVLLTYDLPNWMKLSGEYTLPPIEIKEDSYVELFMAVKIDWVGLEMYVTYGDQDVDLYRRQRMQEDGLGLDGGALSAPRPIPLREKGFTRSGYLIASEKVLMEICTPEEMNKIHKALMPYEGEGCNEETYESDTSESSTNSFDLPLTLTDGVISLEEVHELAPQSGSSALAMVATSGRRGQEEILVALKPLSGQLK